MKIQILSAINFRGVDYDASQIVDLEPEHARELILGNRAVIVYEQKREKAMKTPIRETRAKTEND